MAKSKEIIGTDDPRNDLPNLRKHRRGRYGSTPADWAYRNSKDGEAAYPIRPRDGQAHAAEMFTNADTGWWFDDTSMRTEWDPSDLPSGPTKATGDNRGVTSSPRTGSDPFKGKPGGS